MTLTQDRLKQIIKEELDAIMNEVTEETVDPEVAALEATIAEAKKKLAAKAMSGKRGMKGKVANTGKMTTVKPKINGNAGKTGKVKK
jgi:glutamyl-tRNA reductase